MKKRTLPAVAPAAALAGIAMQDLVQKDHALRRNFPVIARLRYIFAFGTDNDTAEFELNTHASTSSLSQGIQSA